MMAENKRISDAFDPNKAKVSDLKLFLRDHNQRVSGVKSQLVERAKGVLDLNLPNVKLQREIDEKSAEARHLERLVTPLGENLPDPVLLKSGWTEDINKIPNFTESDVYNYLVFSKCRTTDGKAIKANRQLRGKLFLKDRHVYNVQYHDINEGCSHAFVKSKVIRSLPQDKDKKPDYDTWVCLAKVTGRVHSAGCGCEAGEGESCNHVAALLYTMVNITEEKIAGLTASTSKACLWNRPRARKLSPKKSQDLVFKKLKFDDRENVQSEVTKKLKSSNTLMVKPMNLEAFCDKLKAVNPHAAVVLCSDFNKLGNEKKINTTGNVSEDLGLTTVNFQYANWTDLNSASCNENFDVSIQTVCEQSDAQFCRKVEERTRGQTKNIAWVSARKGRITSSIFGTVCKKKPETEHDGIVKSVFGYSTFKTSATEWGLSHEPAARRMYVKEMKTDHPDIEVLTSGLILKSDQPYLACSPDGIIKCSCEKCFNGGIIEIKCPFKHRFLDPKEATKYPSFCCTIVDGHVKLKRNHNYFYQVQGQMAISNKKWCDFYVWTLKGTSVERIELDEKFCESMFQKTGLFYRQYIVPELFSSRIKRGRKLNQTDIGQI